MSALQQIEDASTFQVLDLEEARDAVFVSAWQKLSLQARVANPFFDPAFCLPAMEMLGDGHVKLAVVGDGHNGLRALVPFTTGRYIGVGPSYAKLWAHHFLPLGSPLVAQEDDDAFAELMLGLMEHVSGPVIAPEFKRRVDLGAIRRRGLVLSILSTHERAAMQTSERAGAYRRITLSKQRRQGFDRRYRRLAERTAHLGTLTIDLCDNPAHVPSRFEDFMRLEKLGWKGGNKTALLNKERHADFARRAALGLPEHQTCIVATLRAGETVLAALVLFRIKDEFFSWKTAFDETYHECSPGAQLLARCMDDLMETGKMIRLDSCSSPDNDIANAIWGEREVIEHAIFSRPVMTGLVQSLIRAEKLKTGLKNKAKALLRR